MKAKALIPLVLALILGVLTFVIGRRVLNKQAVAALPQAGARVLVAGAALPAGHQLTAADVQFAETPIESISATMFSDAKALEGRILTSPVEAGQILRQSLLAPEGTSSALQSKVPAGMRAVTISVNEFSGLAGLISPGVKVDLVATLNDNVSGETFAKTIVQNVVVSAVGQEMEAGAAPKNDPRSSQRASKTVTLLVTPTQAAAIDLAFSKSKPRLVLRSSDDDATVVDQGVTMAELSGRADKEDRLAESTKNESADQLKEMLAAMQKQIEGVVQANRDATARQAADEVLPEAQDSQGHSVRVFRGGAESREQFDAQGQPTGAPDAASPATRPARETQRVEGAAKPADTSARAAAGE